MDSISWTVDSAGNVPAAKVRPATPWHGTLIENRTEAQYMLIITTTLTLYDYLLMLDDEVRRQSSSVSYFSTFDAFPSKIRYVWKGRKSPISYLYIS
ncbi:hypothetical protein BDM02DRAFT_3109572, partial [Thelephora ganbajun]